MILLCLPAFSASSQVLQTAWHTLNAQLDVSVATDKRSCTTRGANKHNDHVVLPDPLEENVPERKPLIFVTMAVCLCNGKAFSRLQRFFRAFCTLPQWWGTVLASGSGLDVQLRIGSGSGVRVSARIAAVVLVRA